MVRCIKCMEVGGISKAGKAGKRQRYFCKYCQIHFVLPDSNSILKNDFDKKQSVTIKDIAEALQISFSTVSKALLNNPTINAVTKRKVHEMALKMNYQPNLNAKTLARHTSSTIGIIIPSIISSSFYPELLQGIQEILSERRYHSIICLSHESYEIEIANCNQLINSRVDGVLMSITTKTIETDHIRQFDDHKIPYVFINRAPEGLEAARITVNNYEAGCKAVQHLIEKGCKRIAHIAGPSNLLFSKERLKGYCDTLLSNQLPILPELIVHNDLYTANSKECVNYLLNLDPRPDGIFAYTDLLGIEIIQACKMRGISIPQDICVIGMGNNPISVIIEPQLSTINGATVEMGKVAAEILLEQIETKKRTNTHRLLDVELVARDSTDRSPQKKRALNKSTKNTDQSKS